MKHQPLRGAVTGWLLFVASICGVPSAIAGQAAGERQQAPQQRPQEPNDTRPRVLVESGPPARTVDPSLPESAKKAFREGFSKQCSAAVIADARPVGYTVRLTVSRREGSGPVYPTGDWTLVRTMDVFRGDGTKVFSDVSAPDPGTPDDKIVNPTRRFVKEACALTGYGLEEWMVRRMGYQIQEREPQVHVEVTLKGSLLGKTAQELTREVALRFSEACFSVAISDQVYGSSYLLEITDQRSWFRPERRFTVTISIPRGGGDLFAQTIETADPSDVSPWIKKGCTAIIAGEEAPRDPFPTRPPPL